ncbi:MAG: hypothetical protein HN348_06860 [Proteobacteria bacterium]|nr:hypothetical protein [Pseudomonadota bacterium]
MVRTILFLGIFGCEGPAGPAGVDGVDGTGGLDGSAADRLVHRNSFSGYDNIDDGLLSGRNLVFDKVHDDTWLRLTYYDNFGCYSGTDNDPCQCIWELLINDASCKNDGPIEGYISSVVIDMQHSSTIGGWCNKSDNGKLAAGSYEVEVDVTATGNCDCYTGFDNMTGFLEAEELY